MKVKRKSDGAVVYESEKGFSLKGWDQQSQTYYGNNVRIRRVGQGVPVVTAEDIAKKKEEAKPKTTAAAILSGDGNVGGTFLGGYKVTPQKKREYTAEDYAAALRAAEEAEEREKYLAALDLDAQQKKIDALSATIDSGPKLNIHAFGGYDPKGETEAERELATLRRDYNEAESIQYDMEGARVLDSLDRETRQQVEDYATGSQVEGMNGWAAGKELLAKGYTEEEINRMADYRRRQINKEKMDKAVQRSIEFANTGAGSEAVGSVWSVPQNLVGGITGSLSLGLQNLQNWISGSDRPVDYNAPAFRGTKKANAFREQVAQNIYQYAETEAKGNVNAFLYQTGMSMADSAAIYGLTLMGVPAAASTTLLSSSAAVNGALEAKERGASDEQALAVGVFSGAAEWVFERISLDSLLKAKPATGTIRQQVTQMLKNAGLQAGVEGSEEVFTSLANSITDALVMGDLSALETSIRAYMAQGMTETDAKKKAYGDFAKQLALDFLGGALSGGIMGGVAGTINEAAMNRSYGEMYGESAQELVQEALEINPESTAAQHVAEKFDEGKKISGGELREVVLENQKAIDKAQREAAMAEQERRNTPPTAKVEGKLTLPDGRKISTYTSDEKGNAFWVTDEGTVKGEEQDSSVVGAANKWGGDIGRVIVEQYDGADEATYAAAADVFVELGIQSVDGEMTWDKAAEITGAFVDEVGLEHANALYSAGVSAARSPAFRQYYHAGLIGNEMGSVSVQGKHWLSDAVRQYAYELGQAHAKDEKRHKYTVSKKAGFDSTAEGAKKLNRETRRVLDRIGKALGVEIRFATEEDHLSDDANGLYDAATGTIIISPNATNPVMVVVAHEVTHRFQDMDFEAYKQYRRFVIGKMEQRTGTMAVTKLRDRYRVFLGNNNFTDLQAMDELAADYTLAMIEDGNLFRKLKEDSRSTARKLWSALKNFISRLTGSQPKGYSLYGTTIEELREAEKLWRGMLDGKKQAEEGNVWDAVVGGRYSLKDGENRLENTQQQAYTETTNFEEGVENGRERKETRESFLRRAAGAGYAVYEGTAYAYGFRPVQRQSAQRNARQVQEELRALGIDAEIIDGPILWNRKGVTVPVIVEQAATVEGRIFISDTATIASRNVAGHEAFHLWKNGANRDVYIETVEDNLLFASESFREYQSTIAKAYLGGEADFTNAAQMAKLREELFAYISGDIHEGVHDVNLRPMFRDLDAVKAAWNELVEANKVGVRHSLKTDSAGRQLSEAQAAFFKNSKAVDNKGNLKRLYHGTQTFGFTVFDKSKLDDGFSIFMTDAVEVAESYSGTKAITSTVKQTYENRVDPYTASIEDVVDEYNWLTNQSVKLLNTKEKLQKWAENHLAWSDKEIKRANDLFDSLLPRWKEEVKDEEWGKNEEMLAAIRAFEPFSKAYRLAANAVTADEMDAAHDALMQAKKLDDDIDRKNVYYWMFRTSLQTIRVALDFKQAAKAIRAAEAGQTLIAQGNDYVLDEQQIREDLETQYQYEDSSNLGNYAVYANITNPFIVNCNDRHWNDLILPKKYRQAYIEAIREDPGDGRIYATTRDVVKIARHLGHDGVIFNDIIDVGAEAYDEYVSNVYVAFESNQVKDIDNLNPTEDEDIRYSLKVVPPVEPTSKKWRRGATFDEVKAKHPTLFALDADEAETRNPTQINGTVKTYRKIYNALRAEGFDGTILDASSGLGYGTEAGRMEFGYDVDDIEPFPDAKYKPRYTDYSKLHKKYDYIISNAVLNVMPQDLRDAMVVKIGDLLNDGGRAFINVRGTDVKNASSKVAIDDDLMEYFISNTGSYQKGFTVKELKAYLEDALGDGFTVTPSNMGGVSVIVTKDSARFSLKDSEGNALTEEQAAYFANSKSVDAHGNLRVMYRGGNSGFTVFDRKKSSYSNLYGRGFYFTDSKSHAEQYGNARAFYLNITNPVPTDERTITKEQLLAFLQAVAENEDDYSFENYGYGATPESMVDAIYSGKSDFAMLYDVSQTAIGDMVEAVELFNEINGTDFDGLILDTETVTFRSEQAKLTSNETPTDDPDIRFSLKSPVEQTARLIALHNLTEEKLLGDLKLGGLPMPSIAVVLAEAGHAKYGDISLVFGKDTIDPQFMRRNKVYGGDAWTPTFPAIEYEVNETRLRNIRNYINAWTDKKALSSFGYMGLDSDNMEHTLNRYNGDVVTAYRYNTGMKYAYIAATQPDFKLPMKEEALDGYSKRGNEIVRAVADTFGAERLRELQNGGFHSYDTDKEAVKKLIDIINAKQVEKYGEIVKKLPSLLTDESRFTFGDFDFLITDALRYATRENKEAGQEVDTKALKIEIDKIVDQEAYEQWVRQLFDGIIKKSGIRNERDLFTPSGNRRSFDALHYEVTLENIVKAMQNATQKGGGAFFGGGEIWGVATKDYGSIEDIRADSGRLGMLSDDEYHDIREGFSDRLAEICTEIADPRGGNRFIAIDNAAAAIVETLRTKKTVAAIDKELRSYSYLNVKSDTAEKALELFRDIQNMPTGYFEAKPQRAVGFDEVLAAVVPDNTGEALLSQLAERGINVLTYKQGDDSDRLRAVNSVEDAKFSLKSDAAMGNTLRDMAEAEDATKQAVKAWIRDVHRGKKVSVSYDEAERVARNLINDYRSTADSMNVTGAVLDLFNYLQNGDGNKNMDEATVQEKANAVAAVLLSEELRGSYYTADYVETGNGMELSDLAQDNEELRAFLRGTKIVYPKQYVSDLGTETWTEFTAGLKGARARLSDENNRANVDTLYRDDLSRMWPQYFPDSITGEAAMMQRIAEVSRKVFEREAMRRDNADGEVMTRLTAADVLDRFFNLPQVGKTYISVKNIREKSAQAVQRLQKQMDTRNKQVSRAGIIRKVKALDKKLRDNTEKSHVPDHLRRAVLELCSMFTQNTSVFDRYRLAEIKRQYALLNDSDMAAVYDEDINEMLDELAEVLDGRRLSELKTTELRLVSNVVDHFTHLVNNANAAFVAGRRLEVSVMAQQVISKAITDKPRKTTGLEHTKLAGIERLLTTSNIKPYYLFQSIGGEMQTLFEDMLAGQDRYGRVMDGAKTFREGVYRKYNAEKWITGKQKLEMTTEHGDKIQLTVEEALSLMALYKRELANQEQEAGHLSKGGIVYQQQLERIVKNSKDKKDILRRADSGAKPISFMDLQEISRWLRENVSAQAEAFVDEMVGYLSTDMAELGNETSMALSGIRKFTEGYYFPYKVASQYLETKPGQQKDTSTFSALRNMGFTKRTVKRANAPIVLRNFMDVWSDHVSQMATYATMAVPQDNLLRVLNYKDVLVDEEDGTNINKSVKVSLENTYGTKTLEYIEQLLRDMNGGVVNDPREQAFGTLVRLYKKNAVGLSLSVAIQQPTAAIIDPKYFLTAPRRGDYAQLRKYAGVAVIKEMGGFDTNMGYGSAAWLRGREGAGDIANAAISVLPQKMDQLTWMYLWNVVKAETRDKHPALLDNGQETEAFLIEAGKRFSEVVEKTQVYDSVLTRSENMRSKSVITNLAVAFMSEPTVTLNMAVAALRSGDKKQLARVPAALLVSIIVNSIVKALWTAGRDEDEDETYAEKWLAKFVSYASSDLLPTSYIPIVKELMDILKGYSTAIELYEPIEDLISKYGDVAEKWQDNGIEAVATEETLDFLLAISSLTGIPLDNVKRDIETIVNLCTKMAPADEATQRDVRNAVLEGLGREPKLSQELRKAWSANRSGNERKRKAALAEIDGIYQDKVDKKVAGGMNLADACKEAKSEMKSSCTRYLKPMYLEATGLEKNEVKSFALRIGVGGQQLYADYDFNRYWSE